MHKSFNIFVHYHVIGDQSSDKMLLRNRRLKHSLRQLSQLSKDLKSTFLTTFSLAFRLEKLLAMIVTMQSKSYLGEQIHAKVIHNLLMSMRYTGELLWCFGKF